MFINNFLKNINEHITIREKRFKKREMLRKIFNSVLNTPYLRCNPNAKTEIHTLTANHHLFMYLTAIKSFLRYFNDVAVVVHDDGSLSYGDTELLKAHIAGIRIIEKNRADREMEMILKGRLHSRKFRQSVINSMELYDNIILSRCDKIITMNSDVLFLNEPHELINWICKDSYELLSVYEQNPKNQKEFLLKHNCPLPPHVTICLTCLYKQLFDIGIVESTLADSRPDWFTGQNIYPLLFSYKIKEYPLTFLDKNTYQASGIFTEGAIFRHYWTSTGLFTDLQIVDSSRVISELNKIDKTFLNKNANLIIKN